MAYYNESFEEKMYRLENTEQKYFADKIDPDIQDIYLCHGLRIWALDKLECIFQQQALLPGKYVPNRFDSIDGKNHVLFVDLEDPNNTNMGEYISLAPSKGNLNTVSHFIRRNIFLAFNKDVPARESFYLYYGEYQRLRNLHVKTKNLYSYVEDEYFVEEGISLDNLEFIGIDSANYHNYDADLKDAISGVIKLMKAYEIGIPFIDIGTGIVLYEGIKKEKEIK